MYRFELAVAGRLDAPFEQRVVDVLGTMGIVVREGIVTSAQGRYAWARVGAREGERPTLALRACRLHDTEMVTVDVRGPRHPAHGLMLAQQLSRRGQGFAAAMINDRLTDHYGLGFFFAGFPLEGLMRTPSFVTARFGADRHAALPPLGVALWEEMNLAAWKLTGAALTGATPPWACSETVHAFVIEGAAGESVRELDERWYRAPRAVPTVSPIAAAPAAFSCATIAGLPLSRLEGLAARARVDGWRTNIEVLAPSYDVGAEGNVDEAERPVLLLASTQRPDDLRRLVEQAGAVATVAYLVPDAFETWSKARFTSWEHGRGRGAAALASAWSPITALLSVGPIHFSFAAAT